LDDEQERAFRDSRGTSPSTTPHHPFHTQLTTLSSGLQSSKERKPRTD
jgi:hypothetical protein